MKFAVALKDRFSRVRLHTEETAQDGFEYLLVVGGVSVGVVAAMVAVPGLIDTVVDAVETAIDGVLDITP